MSLCAVHVPDEAACSSPLPASDILPLAALSPIVVLLRCVRQNESLTPVRRRHSSSRGEQHLPQVTRSRTHAHFTQSALIIQLLVLLCPQPRRPVRQHDAQLFRPLHNLFPLPGRHCVRHLPAEAPVQHQQCFQLLQAQSRRLAQTRHRHGRQSQSQGQHDDVHVVAATAHETYPNIVDEDLFEAVRQRVLSRLCGSISDAGHADLSFESPSHPVVDSFRLAP